MESEYVNRVLKSYIDSVDSAYNQGTVRALHTLSSILAIDADIVSFSGDELPIFLSAFYSHFETNASAFRSQGILDMSFYSSEYYLKSKSAWEKRQFTEETFFLIQPLVEAFLSSLQNPTEGMMQTEIQLGDYVCIPQSLTIESRGKIIVSLTPIEMKIFSLFVENPNFTFSFHELRNHIGRPDWKPATMRTFISTLRKKLAPLETILEIITDNTYGYFLDFPQH